MIVDTIEEANALIDLINIAIKANGFPSAKNGVYFIEKIQAEFAPKKEEEVKK